MWVVLGVIGSIAMVTIEAMAVTDIGYWWAALPIIVGIVLQITGIELLELFD